MHDSIMGGFSGRNTPFLQRVTTPARLTQPKPRVETHQRRGAANRAVGDAEQFRYEGAERGDPAPKGMPTIRGNILVPQGFVSGDIEIDEATGRIASVVGEPIETTRAREGATPIVVPGFIDLHVHGGGGRDIMEGEDSARVVAEVHARHGTTALLATTMTAPPEDLTTAFRALSPWVMARADRPRAQVLGAHLEGPYISATRLGAQPAFARALSRAEIARLDDLAKVRVVTLAPEASGNLESIAALLERGIVVQLGHSDATYEEGKAALERGARSVTHLFNAMSPLHHRSPGLVGAALAHAEYAELIVDLLHVHPGAVRAALRSIPRAYCVTDSTSAAGMPDGEYRLGRQTVSKCGAGVRLADGTLAGSTLTMDRALANLVDEIGLDLAEASRRVSTYAAELVGVSDRGRLEPGAFADVVVLDRDLRVTEVITEGRVVAS